mmetsp:Transcript_41336/g.50284  ORF Transcript_41336/g.50284 Transcript_41336/m.50284 type:complete len:83 (+) Transcript_41336:791-1039(+)
MFTIFLAEGKNTRVRHLPSRSVFRGSLFAVVTTLNDRHVIDIHLQDSSSLSYFDKISLTEEFQILLVRSRQGKSGCPATERG